MAALVQQKTSTVTSGTMAAITLDSATTAGNLLVVCVTTRSATVSGISGGGTWTETKYQGGSVYAGIWSCPNCSSTSSVTVTLSGDTSVDSCVSVQEYSGIEASPVDTTNSGSGTAATMATGSVTPSQANNLVVGMAGVRGTLVSGPTGSFTALTSAITATPYNLFAAYKVQTAADAASTSWTNNDVGFGWSAVIVAYKATAATPTWTTPANSASMSTTPQLQFNSPTSAVAQHFYLQLDTDPGFATGNLRTYDSSADQTNWTYWDGDSWEALPAGGLASGMSGNEIRYTVTSALSSSTWYRRVRAGTLV